MECQAQAASMSQPQGAVTVTLYKWSMLDVDITRIPTIMALHFIYCMACKITVWCFISCVIDHGDTSGNSEIPFMTLNEYKAHKSMY